MWGQVAKYLLKGMMNQDDLPADMDYICYGDALAGVCRLKGEHFLDNMELLFIFMHRAQRLAYDIHGLAKTAEKAGKTRVEVENMFSLPLQVAGRAHIEVFIFTEAMRQLDMLPDGTPAAVKDVLKRLYTLFGLTTIAGTHSLFAASFLGDGYLSNSQLANIGLQIDILVNALLPDAIALTDVWCFSDGTLPSAMACANGDIYTRLMAWTKQVPINVEAKKNGAVFKKGWEESIKPFIERDLGYLNVRANL